MSAKLYLLICFVLSMDLTLGLGKSRDSELTFILPAGKTECFFQTTLKNWSMEVEFQVIAGGSLDVGFTLISPSGYRLVSDFKKSDGIHRVDLTEEGDYRLCFDNSFSKLFEKMVFFDVIIDRQEGDNEDDEPWVETVPLDSSVVDQLEDFTGTMLSVYWHLEKSRQLQMVLKAFEARDRYLLEDNLWRVSFWSSLNLLVMVTVAITQIYTLRRLFDDKKKVRT